MLFTSAGLQGSIRSGGVSRKKCAVTLGPQEDSRVISPACSGPLSTGGPHARGQQAAQPRAPPRAVVRRAAEATQRAEAVSVSGSSSEDADRVRKSSWATHPGKEMVFSSKARPASALGSTDEVQTMSTAARLQRKKYMGLWRLALWLTTAMTTALPVSAAV